MIIFFMSIFYAYKQAILATYSMYYVCFGAHKKMTVNTSIDNVSGKAAEKVKWETRNQGPLKMHLLLNIVSSMYMKRAKNN